MMLYLQEQLTQHVMQVVETAELDLCTDPGEVSTSAIIAEKRSSILPDLPTAD